MTFFWDLCIEISDCDEPTQTHFPGGSGGWLRIFVDVNRVNKYLVVCSMYVLSSCLQPKSRTWPELCGSQSPSPPVPRFPPVPPVPPPSGQANGEGKKKKGSPLWRTSSDTPRSASASSTPPQQADTYRTTPTLDPTGRGEKDQAY